MPSNPSTFYVFCFTFSNHALSLQAGIAHVVRLTSVLPIQVQYSGLVKSSLRVFVHSVSFLQAVIAHVLRLTKRGLEPKDIGIITPYNAQVRPPSASFAYLIDYCCCVTHRPPLSTALVPIVLPPVRLLFLALKKWQP